MAHELSGVVVVDKPSGPTSFDVVRRVKGLFKARRCGHTGTLDPTATGVLPICIGDATKIASFVSEGEKEYDAVVGCGVHLRELKRARVGPFGLEDSVGLDTLMATAKEGREHLDRFVHPLSRALTDLAELKLDVQLARRVAHGHAPGPADLSRLRASPYPRGRKVRLMDPEGRVLAVAESDGVGTLKLLRVLVSGAHDLVDKDY